MRKHYRSGGDNLNRSDTNNTSGDSESTPLISRASSRAKTWRSRLSGSLEDERIYVRWPAKILHTVYEILVSNYANVFLVFVPLGIVAGVVGWDPVTIFVLNFLAIIPLAGLLAFATEELAAKVGFLHQPPWRHIGSES